MCEWKTIAAFGTMYLNAAMEITPKSRNEEELITFLPSITLQSFACELYLKAMITFEGNTFMKGHNLDKLFNLLGEKAQTILKSSFFEKEKISSDENEVFLQKLQCCSNYFIDSRYIYEHKGLKSVDFFLKFSNILYSYVIATINANGGNS